MKRTGVLSLSLSLSLFSERERERESNIAYKVPIVVSP